MIVGWVVSGWWIVLLRLPYLTVTSVFAFIRLLPMSDRDKDIEILRCATSWLVLQTADRQAARSPRADRAFLAALLHQLPMAKLRQLHLLVLPGHGPAVAP